MHQNAKHILWTMVFCCLCFSFAQAQNEIRMPYSSYGIGTISHLSNGTLDAMGSVSYAMQNPYYINFRNPASYAALTPCRSLRMPPLPSIIPNCHKKEPAKKTLTQSPTIWPSACLSPVTGAPALA